MLARNSAVTNSVLLTLQMKKMQCLLQLAVPAVALAPDYLPQPLLKMTKKFGAAGENSFVREMKSQAYASVSAPTIKYWSE